MADFFCRIPAQAGARSRTCERGFTLIEMMVALAVFSLAALALIRLEGASFRGASTLDRSLLAGIVVRNVAVDAQTAAQVPTLGTAQGDESNGGRTWRWTRVVAPVGDGNRVFRIDVTVADASGTAAKLTVLRDSPPPAPAPVPSPPP
ncbi:type II secretion system minor pseudopilin GspI [Sphingomonas sp.]|uniref:type II secretion system minor pseudopilin GspI n=1 Tax=Sphingomonas sp. TaxID=28214 RepID=UPI002E37BAB9|nr:type II secretion system minor pseudopilin GspI [Sphingomonas sp.]HEX4693968.1 type II secretion system minor pseudopilin GspI [Sphingomonas sp.]